MATDAQTLINAQSAAGYEKLSERELDECVLVAVSGGASAQSLISSAISQGYDKLSEREIKESLLALASPPAQSAQSIVSTATTAGYQKLSERELKECILVATSSSPPPPAKFWTPPSFPLEAVLGFTLGVTDLNTFDFVDFGNLAGLFTISFPMTSGDVIVLGAEPDITDITGLEMTSINNLQLANNPSLTNVLFPLLQNIGGLSCPGCPVLVTVNIGNSILADGQTIDFTGDALNVASINAILRRCVLSGLTSSDIELSLGTNAAPTGQGLLDKSALILAGNTVNTN